MRHAKEAVTQRKRSVAAVMIPAAFIVAPAALFYDILFSHLTNLPDYWDDYNAVLQFLNQMVQERSAAGRALWLLAAQHNEYKLYFLHGLAWAQFALLGHTNFVQLCVLGDMSVLVLALLLWSMFLPEQKDLGKRLASFRASGLAALPIGILGDTQLGHGFAAKPLGHRFFVCCDPLLSATLARGLRGRAAFVHPGDRVLGQRVFGISGWASDSYRAAPTRTSRGPACYHRGVHHCLRLSLRYSLVAGA